MTWKPIETAPSDGLILIAVCAGKERRVFASEASHEPELVWMVTTGWAGWTRLHKEWKPVGWMPLPPPPEVQP